MKPLRLVLADDHALVRAGIRALVEKLPGVEVVGEAGDGAEALELVKARQPDLLLLDIAMPRLNGLETAERLAHELPSLKVLILSMHADQEYVIRALRAGARGYLLKDSATTDLGAAIEAVARGETYLSPAIPRTVIDRYLARVTPGEGTAAQPRTPR